MEKSSKIYVAGHRGLVGSALIRILTLSGYTNIVTRSRTELDLLSQQAVRIFFETEKPEFVFLAAATVGGIMANKKRKADFIYENLEIQNNVIESARRTAVTKLLFLGSSCIYPKLCPQPIKEEYLLTGPLEESNDAYAIAKIAGIKLCQSFNEQYGTDYIAVMPTNLYGPEDNFDLESSHVLPALIRKFHEAKMSGASAVTLWGTGTPRREFLHVDDLAGALLFLMNTYSGSDIINIGTGEDISIKELATMIHQVVGFEGEVVWDAEKPEGTPRKLLDVSKLHGLGWTATLSLEEGVAHTYKWFKENRL